ncbi:snrpD2 (nucleomorph) [Hemiselmis andersenii]|uniref:SnrpD2 n=1 Tax=Hemiselmis andersenii TaxID=464988 RepID=A9BLC2_HEMAN|nr:snrpD2 [Hemiselmis andersenii]ABW98305.1 snrpD2 [Hemiselmis andersenii]|mmetsp:Transcript_27937/g.68159  ORF Transcript_27937/g.68159 Transcript_27937/m.68159 type:complete len:85 (-) Transcript_27937:6201-6455(-)
MLNCRKKKASFFFQLAKFWDKKIIVITKIGKKLKGRIFAYDSYFNLILKSETILKKNHPIITKKKQKNLIFIRGEQIVLIKFRF